MNYELFFNNKTCQVGGMLQGKDLRQYIRYLRQREEELAAGWVQLVPPLAIETEGVNSEGIMLI